MDEEEGSRVKGGTEMEEGEGKGLKEGVMERMKKRLEEGVWKK